jgi:ribosomal protein L22
MATKIREDGRPEVRAQAKWLRMSPRKARLAVEHIRGRSVPEARTVLAFTDRAAAREVEKVLRSAVANAEANHNLVGDELIVATATVDEGPTMKRFRARARGRAARIQKKTCHITLTLTTLEALPEEHRRRRILGKADTEPTSEEIHNERVEKHVAEAQAGHVSPAEEAEGAASEEKPKQSRRRKKTEDTEQTEETES